jgi:two-component sensor histidine kinase
LRRNQAVNSALAELLELTTGGSFELWRIADAVLRWSAVITGSKQGLVCATNLKTGDMDIISATPVMKRLAAESKIKVLFPERGSRSPGPWKSVLYNRMPFYHNDADKSELLRNMRRRGAMLKNLCSIPAMTGEFLQGQILLANTSGEYSDRDLAAITHLGRTYALAVLRSNSEEQDHAQSAGRMAGNTADGIVELVKTNEKLMRGVRAILKTERMLKASLRERRLYLEEIHHRVKNNMQILSCLVETEAQQVSDEGARRVLLNTRSRIQSMAKVHEKLFDDGTRKIVDFRKYGMELVSGMLASCAREGQIEISGDIGEIPLDTKDAVCCGLIINEIVTSAVKRAVPGRAGKTISVSFNKDDGGRHVLSIRGGAAGPGDPGEEESLDEEGIALIHALARQIRGTITIEEEGGTGFTITFPDHQELTDDMKPARLSIV